jgi:hypothetical protein
LFCTRKISSGPRDVRRRPQQHTIDQAEHRGVGADAQREGGGHGGRDGGRAANLTERVRSVVPERVEAVNHGKHLVAMAGRGEHGSGRHCVVILMLHASAAEDLLFRRSTLNPRPSTLNP